MLIHSLSLLHLGKADCRPGSSGGSPFIPAAAAAEATQTAVDAPLLALVSAHVVVVGPDDPVLLDLGPKLIALLLFALCECERLKQCT